MARLLMSFFDSTSMLRGTSCRFSSRLRAVTIITSRPPLAALSASAASADACGTLNPAMAAATARPIAVLAPRGQGAGALGKPGIARFGLRVRMGDLHERLEFVCRARSWKGNAARSSFARVPLVNSRAVAAGKYLQSQAN